MKLIVSGDDVWQAKNKANMMDKTITNLRWIFFILSFLFTYIDEQCMLVPPGTRQEVDMITDAKLDYSGGTMTSA